MTEPDHSPTMLSALLPAAHHDGSELYVPQQLTAVGEVGEVGELGAVGAVDAVGATAAVGPVVPLRVRVSDPAVTAVYLRTVEDGEPRWLAGTAADVAGPERWWTAELPLTAPLTHYRFLLVPDGGQPYWLNAAGLWSRDVTDRHDFRLTTHDAGPDWAVDKVVYQVFPDRFARAAGSRPVADITPDWAIPCQWDEQVLGTGPEVPRQFYGGDLDGVREHLGHLVGLGVGCLYLTPVFPARSNHRYNASSFGCVDPLLGGDRALTELVTAAHDLGLQVIGDITTNHSGDDHPWFTRALAAAPGSPDRGFYYLDDSGEYVAWLGVSSLPKLNFGSTELREQVYGTDDSVIARWLRPPFDLDGWRVDVANMTGRHGAQDDTLEVARGIRHTVDTVRPGSVLLAEHGHDYTDDLIGDGWQATMNYAGFTRPVWSWLAGRSQVQSQFLGVPGGIVRRGAEEVVATMNDFDGSVPWSVRQRNWKILDSHDTPRFAEVTSDPAQTAVGVGLQFTLPGVPMVFAGAELGLGGSNGEQSRRPMPWGDPDSWDAGRLALYQELIGLHSCTRALRRGGLRWLLAQGDVLAFLRETADERILVVAARDAWSGAALPAELGRSAETLYGGTDLVHSGEALTVSGIGPAVGVWRLS